MFHMTDPQRREEISQLARLQGEMLRKYKVGHPEWYAEMLVCAAYDGQLALTNCPGHDLTCDRFGRVQVKCRVRGTDGVAHRVNFRKYKPEDFDHAAIVIFEPDFRIMDAVVLPVTDTLGLMRAAGHVSWQPASTHTNAISIREPLVAVSCET